MIHELTKGGVGNQMFQYAFALLVQKMNGGDGEIFLNGHLHPFSRDKRQHSLHHFSLTDKTHVCTGLQGCRCLVACALALAKQLGIGGMLKLLRDRSGALAAYRERLCDAGVYVVGDIYSAPHVRPRGKGAQHHVFGYFQTPEVIRGIEEELRAAFTVKTPASAANNEMLAQIKQDNAVCLHVRRGDYSLYPQLQVCDERYYREAVRQACEALSQPVFYVFSTGHEDVEWVRNHYRFDADMRYVDLDNPDYEELRLMMACKHFIISNSTFSWWAAVLSQVAGSAKRVWAPTEWLKGSDVRMCLDEWTLI